MDDSAIVLAVLFFTALVAVSLWMLSEAQARERADALRKASEAYQAALAKFKAQPTDASLRQTALEAGRAYSAVVRESKRVTIFDEIALKNDLDAAGAGASVAPAASSPTQPSSVSGRLKVLSQLKLEGLISEDEFNDRKGKILSEI
jgi:high-affinity K+ transport system ATPase subunit B